MMQRDQEAYSTVPLKHGSVTVQWQAEDKAHVAMLRKAPGGTRDPSGPAWPPIGVPKGTLELFVISMFSQICVSDPFNTFPHCKTPAGIYICNGLGLIFPP